MVIMCTSKLISPISGYYEILGRSNEKFHWGLEHESAKAGDCDNNVSASPPPRVQKVQMNSITGQERLIRIRLIRSST